MYRIYRKIPDPFQGDFEFCSKNRYILEEFQSILWLISWSLPDDEGGITCMQLVTSNSYQILAIFMMLFKSSQIINLKH